ncbi:hypothetical protein Z517_04388 [Fonsecaea pedrosoi CBS 271.37]|uniref:Methyltransferase type 11 domain-containing protein n=1 Tax=Fonsecaea pedrosoi CBS 271.37 TaxID=1442368 RepID=A0A0D2GKI3_9EURO|nr:uncharacterized protein Z517_04388 [Fonsecaea pedrosoi CBS 271.37]KIW81363.1 hypothetical protein Z517_04388 [Fonsecaea pedrosoi CBS 271.37]
MSQTVLHSTGESWKELANKKHGLKAGDTVQTMIARMNETLPFATTKGIFDNGCGTGTIITHILDTFGCEIPDSARIIAADFSVHMLEVLAETKRARVSMEKNGWDRLELHNLDAHDLSNIPDGSISHVTGGHLYFLLSDARKALLETRRILESDGTLALSSGKGGQHLDALQDAVEHVRPGTHLRLTREPWASEEGVRKELEATGFVDVETFLLESEVQYKDHLDFAETLLLMPVMKNATDGYGEDERKRLLDQVVENLCGMNPAAPGMLKGTGIIALARKI